MKEQISQAFAQAEARIENGQQVSINLNILEEEINRIVNGEIIYVDGILID